MNKIKGRGNSMRKKFSIVMVAIATFALLGLYTTLAFAEDVSRMTKEELKSMIDDSQVVVIDVRTGKDWEGSTTKIKGAVRENPRKAASWAGKYDKQKTYVLYCA
jgi:predicted sulfurtransferase